MDPATVGGIGGVVGGTIGILGGVVGTYLGIKNTNGPRERALMIRFSAGLWVAVTSFLALLWVIPFPYRAWFWLPYIALLPLAARAVNREQQRIRHEEAGGSP